MSPEHFKGSASISTFPINLKVTDVLYNKHNNENDFEILSIDITDKMSILEQNFETLKSKFNDLNNEIKHKSIFLNSLNNEKYKLTKNIAIQIETEPNNYIASFLDVNAVGFGETESEALNNLKENIVTLYEDLIEDISILGPNPTKWLHVLNEFIIKK